MTRVRACRFGLVVAGALAACSPGPADTPPLTRRLAAPSVSQGLPPGAVILEPLPDRGILSPCSRAAPPTPDLLGKPSVVEMIETETLLQALVNANVSCRPPA